MSRNSIIPPSPGDADYRPEDDAPTMSEQADPFALFEEWFEEAKKKEPNDPNAMALATSGADGQPDVRMVLLKDVGPGGFSFFTNLESAKGRQLEANPKAALLFHWKSLRRQIRIRGPIEPVSAEEADAYFATRARGSQIGAWASAQSRVMQEHGILKRRVAEFALKFGVAQPPRPPHWSGFRVYPEQMEFWRDRPFRLHERLLFTRQGAQWTVSRLFP